MWFEALNSISENGEYLLNHKKNILLIYFIVPDLLINRLINRMMKMTKVEQTLNI